MRRREEHRTLLDYLQRTEKYDKKFKLLEIGINQIVKILRETRKKLDREQFTISSGFPTSTSAIDAFTLIIENTCLIGDMVIQMPDMSETILSKDEQWKEILNWAVEFTLSVENVLDAKSEKMLALVDQEINIEKRTNNYINPYRSIVTARKRTKQKKKQTKGPQLHSADRSEL